MIEVLFLAVEEAVPPTHIAARLSVPLGFLFFSGSVYLLLWSNYGAKKAAAIYGTAFFGFCAMLGVFWWLGAPGTPQNLGLQNLPGQAPDHYQPGWYAFEPGSDRAGFFDVADGTLDRFEPLDAYIGRPGVPPEELEADPRFSFWSGELARAGDRMLEQFLPIEDGVAQIGVARRSALQAEADEARQEGWRQASPFFTAEVVETLVVDDQGIPVAGARLQVFANFLEADGTPVAPIPVGEEGIWYAFRDPGAMWLPSMLWTIISFVLFLASLFWLDAIEQRERRRMATKVEEPEDLAVPIAQ